MRGLRKLLIGLLTLAIVFGIYVLYNRIFPSRVELPVAREPKPQLKDPGLDENSAKIGETAVGNVGLSRFTILDDRKKVKRVFGFAEVLNPDQGSDQWKLLKPYMDIYGTVQAKIFSDRGTVQVEDVAGKPSPADAHLVDNVEIHIFSKDSDPPTETIVYLDDLYYDSERSEFSSEGPIDIVSENGRIKGVGMLLVYNNQLSRIEDFRITDLEYLYVKNVATLDLSSAAASTDHDSKPVQLWLRCKGGINLKPVVPIARAIQNARTGSSNRDNDYYNCKFDKDVVIEYGDDLIVNSGAELMITNILWASPEDESESEKDTAVPSTTTRSPDQIAPVPTETKLAQAPPAPAPADIAAVTKPAPAPAEQKTKPARFYAQRIDYDMTTENALAAGPVKFVHYDKHKPADQKPMTVTATRDAEFFTLQNRIVFNENVEGISYTPTPLYLRQDTFHGQKLIVDMASTDEKARADSDIRHITLTGPSGVRLDSKRTASDQTISHVRLSCVKIDHDTIDNIVLATGPGKIEMDNSKVPHPAKDSNDQGPYYAYMDGFDKLTWLTVENYIIASSRKGAMHMSYLPIEKDGQLGSLVEADTTRLKANFTDTDSGRSLKTLRASGGIHYKEAQGNEFLGDSLFYDTERSLMTVRGSSAFQCMLNGANVERIEYDPKTKHFKSTLSKTPGAIVKPPKK